MSQNFDAEVYRVAAKKLVDEEIYSEKPNWYLNFSHDSEGGAINGDAIFYRNDWAFPVGELTPQYTALDFVAQTVGGFQDQELRGFVRSQQLVALGYAVKAEIAFRQMEELLVAAEVNNQDVRVN